MREVDQPSGPKDHAVIKKRQPFNSAMAWA